MNMPSPLPRSTTLVSPVTISHAGLARRLRAWTATTRRSSSSGSPSSRMKPALRYRGCARHGQVVHRAVDGERADVAAREEERRDHDRSRW